MSAAFWVSQGGTELYMQSWSAAKQALLAVSQHLSGTGQLKAGQVNDFAGCIHLIHFEVRVPADAVSA